MNGIRGINHITLAVDDVAAAMAFYVDVLGCQLLAHWPKGAYFLAGDMWLALVLGEPRPSSDYSHVAFDVAPDEFVAMVERIKASGAALWQDNRSEGDSLYFCDPAGHRLEIHASSLAARLASAAASPWDGLVIETGALDSARGRE